MSEYTGVGAASLYVLSLAELQKTSSTVSYSTVEDVIKQTPPSRRSKFDRNRLKENGSFFEEATARSILGDHFSCNPHMIELVLSLRSIYNKHPDDCPIQIALIVSTVKFIVAYGTGKKRGDDIKRVVMRGVT